MYFLFFRIKIILIKLLIGDKANCFMDKEKKNLEIIHLLLNESEEIEYAMFQKEEENIILVLTNQRFIYSDKDLLKANIFHFIELKKNKVKIMFEIKQRLLLNEDVKNIINTYFF